MSFDGEKLQKDIDRNPSPSYQSNESGDPLSIRDYLKIQLLRNRLGLSYAGAIRFVEQIRTLTTQLIGLSVDKIRFDLEFRGREVDLVFSYEEPFSGKEKTGK